MLTRRALVSIPVCVAVVAVACGSVSAEQVLEMRLQPSGEHSGVRVSQRANVSLPSRGTGSRTEVTSAALGRVAFVDVPVARIHRQRSNSSAVLFSVRKDTPLAVVNTVGDWFGVLMVDGSTGWVVNSDMRVSDLRVVSDASCSGSGSEFVRQAMTFLGIPYVWGGASRSGTDCSGFVKQVWSTFGRSLPRTAREQANVGQEVSMGDLQAGDRLYFACKGGAVDHTGIYVGNGQFIHASSSRGGVAIDSLSRSKYRNALVKARRG